MSGKLYVVGTPIGNLEDFSPRAVRILFEVDFIAAEDTRVTLKLLNHFGIRKPMISYFEHNKFEKGDLILEKLSSGQTAALVTDAGMPAISDPGEDLVRMARDAGIDVESVPGPTAVTTALSISGMKTGRFCFEGFLPNETKEKKERLSRLKGESRTMVFYEAPHRLIKTLKELKDTLGERKVAVCKEITKLHESVMQSGFEDAIRFYEQNEPKGEYVLIVEGGEENTAKYGFEDAVNMAKSFIKDGMGATAAARHAAEITGHRKNEIYKELISL